MRRLVVCCLLLIAVSVAADGGEIASRLGKALESSPKSGGNAVARVERDSDILYRSNGTPRQIRGAHLQRSVRSFAAQHSRDDVATAKEFLRNNRGLMRIDDPDQELVPRAQAVDDFGRGHVRFTQKFRGLEVWPSEVIVHLDRDGDVDLVEGSYVPTPRRIAPRALVQKKDAELLVFARAGIRPRLAWRTKEYESLARRWVVLIDAANGNELTRYNSVETAAARGSGRDLSGVTRTLELWLQGSTFFMLNATKQMFDPASQAPSPQNTRGGIFVADATNLPPTSDPTKFPDSLAVATSSNANNWPVADTVSAAQWMSETYDYYLDRHGRSSIDGAGGTMTGIVRLGRGFPNAFWDDEQQFMVFGDADTYAGSLDVIAHEMTHGITSHTARLVYQDQPGALNEAMSDIFGEMAEARTFGTNDWVIGSQLREKIRNMSNPGLFGDPAKMSQFLVTKQDNGGVHTNSGIINRAYYMLVEGLPGAIGRRDAERIFYRTLTQHLTKDSQFIDARLAAIASAEELFGVGSTQALKTAEAFDAVEIFAAPPVPDDVPIPAVNAADSTIFIFKDGGFYFLGRKELQSDGQLGSQLSRFDVAPSRPSVSADGKTAVFVDSLHDVCLIKTDGSAEEVCLDLPTENIRVSSVSMSPDGRKFAFVLLDSQGQPENDIVVVDLGANTETAYSVDTPVFDGSTIGTIDFADAMTFTADGRFLVFDAFNELTANGSAWGGWSIYALDLTEGDTLSVIPPRFGFDFGFPSLGHTSDDHLTFEIYDSRTALSTIAATNLDTADIAFVATEQGAEAAPSYTGDDRAIVYAAGASNANGADLLIQQVAADHITPAGSPSSWIASASFGVIYRRGTYAGPTTQPGALAFSGTTFNGREGSVATVTVVRSGGVSGQVSVAYSTSNGTATGGSDFSPASGTLTWANGESGPKSFTVALLSDAASEGTESVTLRVTSPSGGATLGSPSTASLNIANVSASSTVPSRRRSAPH